MAKQQVRICDYPECDTHKGVTTWVFLNGAQPRRADYCPVHAAPLEAVWKSMPEPTERKFGRRTEVVTMEEVEERRRRTSQKP